MNLYSSLWMTKRNSSDQSLREEFFCFFLSILKIWIFSYTSEFDLWKSKSHAISQRWSWLNLKNLKIFGHLWSLWTVKLPSIFPIDHDEVLQSHTVEDIVTVLMSTLHNNLIRFSWRVFFVIMFWLIQLKLSRRVY